MLQLAQDFSALAYKPFAGVSVAKVQRLAQAALTDAHHIKPIKPAPSKKVDKRLPLYSCFTAPCKSGCPIGQDIPEYISLVGQGRRPQSPQGHYREKPAALHYGAYLPASLHGQMRARLLRGAGTHQERQAGSGARRVRGAPGRAGDPGHDKLPARGGDRRRAGGTLGGIFPGPGRDACDHI